MLQRTEHSNGVVTYQSPLLAAADVPHAFSTRIGGVSPEPFHSLNLGNPGGSEQKDSPADLAENYQLLQDALAVPLMRRAWVHQVHGRRVEILEHEPENEYAESLDAILRDRFSGQLPADAVLTAERNILLTIRIADCYPILFASEDGRMVAAAHAGWRGIIGSIVGKTVRALHEAGAAPASLIAAIGPGISVRHFEVGEEVAAEFINHQLAHAVVTRPAQKPHINLQAALQTQLQNAGVTRVDSADLCTFASPQEFFSHRRDHGITGRMAAVIAAKP